MASRIFKKEDADKGIFAENSSAQKDHVKLMDYFKQGLNNKVFQLGGNATLGKGLIKSITSLI
jgi:CRISPR/Cas system CMR subunit Cmr4 (Cas7 group RAMP superfamily)